MFSVLRHRAPIWSLLFVLGSPASRPNLVPSFCFGFSSITLRFDPFFYSGFFNITLEFDSFFLFQVLRHHARIQSIRFVLGSPVSRSDSIPSFCFGFSGIIPIFDPFFLFRVLWHHTQIRSLLLFRVLRRHARIRSHIFVSGSPISCPDLIIFYFGFFSILLRFDPFILFWVLWHRAWIRSLLFVSSSLTSCSDFIIFSSIVSRLLIFPGIVLGFFLVLQS